MVDFTSEVPKQARPGLQAGRQSGRFPLSKCCVAVWESELGASPLDDAGWNYSHIVKGLFAHWGSEVMLTEFGMTCGCLA